MLVEHRGRRCQIVNAYRGNQKECWVGVGAFEARKRIQHRNGTEDWHRGGVEPLVEL